MKKIFLSAVILFASFSYQPIIAQGVGDVAADTLKLKWHVFSILEFKDSLNVLPPQIREIVQERHSYVEDTLLAHVRKGDNRHRSYIDDDLSSAKDSTIMTVGLYMSNTEKGGFPAVHYVYSRKRYQSVVDEKYHCFVTNWGGYILEFNGEIVVYADKASTTIPFMYGGCSGSGDDYKTHRIIRPSRVIFKDDEITIKAVTSDWDCQIGVTLGVKEDEVRLISDHDWERCDEYN